MERVVTVAFLLTACLSPLGVLSWLSICRAIRRVDAAQHASKILELRSKGRWRLIAAVLDAVSGTLGYYLVSRRVFPQINVIWIFCALIWPSAMMQIWFRLRWNSLKQQQLRKQVPARNPSAPQ